MKISVVNPSYMPDTEQFKFLKDCGFDATDFALRHYFSRSGSMADIYNVTDEQIKAHFTMLRETAEKVGFEIGQTHGTGSGHPSFCDGDYDEVVARATASIKATHYLGSKYCILHPNQMPGRRYDLLEDIAFDKAVEVYRRLIPVLEEYDVYCCIENMWVRDPVYGHICTNIISHAKELVRMCDTLGERFRICVDTGHGELTQDDPSEMIRICGERLVALHTHGTDGIGDLHTFPFAAHGKPYGMSWKPVLTDWTDLMKALDDVNYKGTLSFEIVPPGPKEIKPAGYRYLASIGRYLASLRENG